MKFLHLIWRNAIRNKRRAVLTFSSIAISIVAVSILSSVPHAFNAAAEFAVDARLVVSNKVSLIFPLPLAYSQRIEAMPGVKSIAAANWFQGVYQDKKNFFPRFAVDAEKYFPMYPEIGIPPAEWKAFMEDRKGCIVGRKIANQYGFKIGDTIPIIGDIFPGDWEFNIHSIYDGLKRGTDETVLYFHWKYLDESLPPRRQGQIGIYVVQIENPSLASVVTKAIDAEFENSADQTITQTEKAFQLTFVKMMGNIELLVRMIGGAVVFALVLVAANTMAMAARERTTEIAILKTIGFRGSHLAGFILAESLLLTLVGWAVGSALSFQVCHFIENKYSNYFPVFPLKVETLALSLGIAVFTGAVSALIPALHSIRTSIVAAMRQVA